MLINGVIITLLGFFIFSRNRRALPNIIFSITCLAIAVWCFAYFSWQIAKTSTSALNLCRILTAGSVFVPITYFHFVVSLIGNSFMRRRIRAIYLGYIAAVLFAVMSFTPFMVQGVVPRLRFPFWPTPGPLYKFFIIYFITYGIYSCYSLLKGSKRATGLKRNQLLYVFVASALGYLGGAMNLPLWYGVKLYPVGNFFISIYACMVAYAIIRYRLLDISIAVSRAGISLVVYTFAFGIPFYVGYVTESWILSASAAVLLAIPSPWLFRYFRLKAERILLAEQHRYQKILLQTADGMAREHKLEDLLGLIVNVAKEAVKVTFSAVFLRDDSKKFYILKAVQNGKVARKDFSFSEKSEFVSYLKKRKEPILPDEMRPFVVHSMGFPEPVGLIVPFFSRENLLGFLFLGEKLSGELYFQDDVNVFEILSHQAALSIENCLFFEEFKKAQNKIFEAEKLASIGGMADGVAHQIKNRLNHFSIVGGEMKDEVEYFAKRHPALVDTNADLKKSINYIVKLSNSLVDNVQRTDAVVKSILEYAKIEEKERFFTVFSLKEIIKLALDLLKVKHQVAQVPVDQKMSIDAIWGVKSQITEAVYNLLDNAYEATQDRYSDSINPGENHTYQQKVTIEASELDNVYRIVISDNGIGIKDENKHKIFAPFFTTKSSYKSGTGIGMYIVKRIVEENHKGKVWFESEYGEGTSFYMELPKQNKQREDL